jgi:glycosyltransferase involved in cell wall biosynthesis
LTVLYDEKAALWQWLFRRIIKWTDGVVTLSTEWNQIRSIVPACRVFCLPNAIDLMPYRQAAQERMAQGKRKRSLKILYMGYLGKAKGSFDLIEAAKQTALDGMEVSFDLVGDELTSGAKLVLRQCVDDANLNGRVRIHPPASGSEKLAFFRNADIFIYPSYHEGMPIAVLEAMACGLPIVATRVGGLPDLVVDGFNGVLAEPGRPDQLAAALYRLSMDDGVRRSMEQRSLQLAVDRYDMEQCVARLVGIYEAVLADGPGRKETHAGFGQSV